MLMSNWTPEHLTEVQTYQSNDDKITSGTLDYSLRDLLPNLNFYLSYLIVL